MLLNWIPYTHIPYLGVLLVLLAAGFGLPVPEDVPLLTGGYLCHAGFGNLYVMILIGLVGVLTGDTVLFIIGQKFGHHVVEHRWIRRMVNPPRLLLAERMFQRHGIKIVFAGRFLPVLRPMIFMAAGVLKAPFSRFIMINGFAACLSVPTLILLGNFFGHNIEQLHSDVRMVTHTLALAVLLIAAVGVVVFIYRRQHRLMRSAGVDEKVNKSTLAKLDPLVIRGKIESVAFSKPSSSQESNFYFSSEGPSRTG